MKQVCKRIARSLGDLITRRRPAVASTYNSRMYYEVVAEHEETFATVSEWPRYHEDDAATVRLLRVLPAYIEDEDGRRVWLEVYPEYPDGWDARYISLAGAHAPIWRHADTLGEAVVKLADEVLV